MKKLIFLVHEKHQAYGRSGIQEAVGFVSDSFQIRRGNENSTTSEVASLPKILNGPQAAQGNVVSNALFTPI